MSIRSFSPALHRWSCAVALLGALPAAPALSAAPRRRPDLRGFQARERQALRFSLELAARRLREPECLKVFSEFQLPDGSTPLRTLEATGLSAEAFLHSMEWENGADTPRCPPGATLATTRNGRRVSVCPPFARAFAERPQLGATLVIHEQLHALGLGEDPPSSLHITARVEHWCR
jgi:hypothetical protein